MISNFEYCPDNWQLKTIGEIAIVQSGTGFPPDAQGSTEGEVPFLKVSDMNLPKNFRLIEEWNNSITEEQIATLKAKTLPAGSVIFPKVGGAIATNKKRVLTRTSCFDNNVMGLKAKDGILDEYLFWLLQAIDLVTWSSSSSLPSMKAATVKEFLVPIPPVGEQERIVAKLDVLLTRIDTAIEHLQECVALTDALYASALDKVFSILAVESKILPFKKLVVNQDGKRIPIKAGERQNTHGTYPYYGATGIIDYVDDFIFEGERLLISEDGANLVARKYPIAFIANGKYWVNNHAHVVDALPELTSNLYLKKFFAWVDLSSYITGSAQPKLSQGKLNTIPVPVPALATQAKIVAELDKTYQLTENLKKNINEKLDMLISLKSSILDSAFKGEL